MLLTVTLFVFISFVVLGLKKPGFSLVVSPFISSMLYIFAASGHFVKFPSAIISLLIFPTVLLIIVFRRYDTDTIPWPKVWAKRILISFFALALLIIMFIISLPLGGIFAGILGLFFGCVIGAVAIGRNSTIAFVISTIGASMRQNLPLPLALQSASENLKYKHSQILRQISKWLVQGYSLSESIKRGFKNCPANITALIAAGEKIGQVPQVVQSIEFDLLENATDSKRIRPVYPAAYFITVLIIMSFLVLSLMIGVIPKFSTVMKDLAGTELPKSTQILIEISDAIVFKYSWFTLAVIGFLFIISIFYLRVKFRPRRTEKPLMLSRIGDFIKWHLPIVRWFEINYSTLQVVEVLKISLNAGTTINEAIRNTIELDVNCQLRKKLKEWLRLVETGENPSDAVRRCGLANSLSLAFERQTSHESTLPVLEMLESVYRSNYSYRVNLARFILLPCTTIVLGAMVGFVAYSIVSAMVEIITICSNFV